MILDFDKIIEDSALARKVAELEQRLEQLEKAQGGSQPVPEEQILFSYSEVEDGVMIEDCLDIPEPDVIVPEQIGGKPVTVIGIGAFSSDAIRTVQLPETVKRIAAYAFGDSVRKVNLPESVILIEEKAFNAALHPETGSQNLTVYCHPGTYASEYAQAHNLASKPYPEFFSDDI